MKLMILVPLFVALANARYQTGEVSFALDNEDWWTNGVFYQIYPRSFKDSNGDGIGDIRGIIEKLDHLVDLGVTGAWLSPIFKSPFVDGGYDIQDFYSVDPVFGTNEDLKELFAKAKTLGIKIILDFVPNHTSDLHEWFVLSANRTPGYEDYYVWRNCSLNIDGVTRKPYNNWVAVFHTPAWTYHPGRDQCYLHQFTPEQPDLNYRNPAVYKEMIDVFKHWLDEGADGFRIDAINHLFETVDMPDEVYYDPMGDLTSYDNLIHTHTMNRPESYEFIYDVRKMMDEYVSNTTEKHSRIIMTEAYATIKQQVLWYGHNDTTRGSHMPFNFALISDLSKESKAADFKRSIDSWISAMPTWGEANWVMGNHDRSRVGYRYGEDRHESLAIMTMLLPGINVVYYGEEILMTDNRNISFEETDDPQAKQTNETVYMLYSRDPVRTPFQWDNTVNAGFSSTTNKTWLPIHENYETVNLKAQQEATKSTYKLYQQLIYVRNFFDFIDVSLETRAVTDDVFGFVRWTLETPIVVIINLGLSQTVSLSDLMNPDDITSQTKVHVVVANNNSTMKSGDEIDARHIELGNYDAVVLEVILADEITTPVDISTPSTNSTTSTESTTLGATSVFLSFTLIVSAIIVAVLV